MTNSEELKGFLLIASPTLVEPTFHRTVVLLIEHGDEGAVGIVLNRPTEESVGEHLPGWVPVTAPPSVIFVGGPVEPEVGLCLAPVAGDPNSPLPGLSLLDLTSEPPESGHVRIYAGYAGWSSGQLESELSEGAWYLVAASPDDPFGDPHGMWERVLRRQPGRLAMVAHFPDDPSLN